MSGAASLLCYVTAATLTIKIWYDLVDFLHYRERMNVYKTIAVEGCKVVKQAMDQDRVGDFLNACITPGVSQSLTRHHQTQSRD